MIGWDSRPPIPLEQGKQNKNIINKNIEHKNKEEEKKREYDTNLCVQVAGEMLVHSQLPEIRVWSWIRRMNPLYLRLQLQLQLKEAKRGREETKEESGEGGKRGRKEGRGRND